MKPDSNYSLTKITLLILFILVLINTGLKFYGLGYPTWFYYDERFFAYTAKEMAEGNFRWDGETDLDTHYELNYNYENLSYEKYEKLKNMPWGKSRKHELVANEWNHPPLGKEITSLGVLIFGHNPIGWRSMPALFGIIGCLTFFLLGRELFKSNTTGLFASFLYTFDTLIFVESRTSLLDIYLLNFYVLASYFFIRYLRSGRATFLILTGLFCGMSLTVKWSGAFPPVLFTLILAFYAFKENRYTAGQRIFKWIGETGTLFVLVVSCYLITYIPYFINGMGAGKFIDLQLTMFTYHTNAEEHIYQSQWWSWPLMLRPARFMDNEVGKAVEHIYAIGNPVIWWGGLIALIGGLYSFIRHQYKPIGFVLISYIFYMVPWVLSPRDVLFIYHYLPSLGFLIIMSGYILAKGWNYSLPIRAAVIIYMVAAAGMFIYLLPVTTGMEIPASDLDKYLWFESWK